MLRCLLLLCGGCHLTPLEAKQRGASTKMKTRNEKRKWKRKQIKCTATKHKKLLCHCDWSGRRQFCWQYEWMWAFERVTLEVAGWLYGGVYHGRILCYVPDSGRKCHSQHSGKTLTRTLTLTLAATSTDWQQLYKRFGCLLDNTRSIWATVAVTAAPMATATATARARAVGGR